MSNNSNLEFRKVPSLDFLYEVSENGQYLRNVKSKKYIKIFLDKHHSKKGYYAAFINFKGKVRRVMIHKIVAECWLGPIPKGYEVDHKDRDSTKNHYTNLRYVTHSEQIKNRQLGEHIIAQATQNCANWIKSISKQTKISKNNETHTFESMTKAAIFIAQQEHMKPEHVRAKMKKRRSNILGWSITYLNAETGHAGSTEQGTVQG